MKIFFGGRHSKQTLRCIDHDHTHLHSYSCCEEEVGREAEVVKDIMLTTMVKCIIFTVLDFEYKNDT